MGRVPLARPGQWPKVDVAYYAPAPEGVTETNADSEMTSRLSRCGKPVFFKRLSFLCGICHRLSARLELTVFLRMHIFMEVLKERGDAVYKHRQYQTAQA
nr:hypothetical protein [Bacillota bacterium]